MHFCILFIIMELQDLSKQSPRTYFPLTGEKNSDESIKLKIFTIMACMNALLNYDTGVVPASLTQIQSEMPINFEETAAIGSSVYVGLCTATLIVSYTFSKTLAFKVLFLNMILNCCFCFLFAVSYNIYLIYFARFGMGFSQAFCVIYAPVWTNHYSPKGKSTVWMGLLQCAVPVGIVLGYGAASVFNNLNISYLNWRTAILLQAVLEIPFILSFKKIKPSYLEILQTRGNF